MSQTTLEQIFQNFANQSIASDMAALAFHREGNQLRLVNADRRETEEQQELSQRGLSVSNRRQEASNQVEHDDEDPGMGG